MRDFEGRSKKRFLVILSLLTVLAILYYCLTPRLYIGTYDKSIKFQVPHFIVLTKNCKKYRDFVHSLAAPMFMPNDDCPWQKVEPVGHFEIGDKTFHIPRDYLWQGKRKPDGKIEAAYLIFKYPSMERGYADGDEYGNLEMRKHNIVTTISDASKFTCNRSVKSEKEFKKCYRLYLLGGSGSDQYDLVKFKYHPDLDLDEYLIYDNSDFINPRIAKHYGDKFSKERLRFKRFFMKGDPDDIEYGLYCERYKKGSAKEFKIMRCRVKFLYSKNIYVEYRFRALNLENHKNINKKVIEKLNEFTLQNNNQNKE